MSSPNIDKLLHDRLFDLVKDEVDDPEALVTELMALADKHAEMIKEYRLSTVVDL